MSQTSLQARVQSLAESLRASEEKCAELESCGMRYKAVEDEVKRLRKELEVRYGQRWREW